jgi:hypothetical protein
MRRHVLIEARGFERGTTSLATWRGSFGPGGWQGDSRQSDLKGQNTCCSVIGSAEPSLRYPNRRHDYSERLDACHAWVGSDEPSPRIPILCNHDAQPYKYKGLGRAKPPLLCHFSAPCKRLSKPNDVSASHLHRSRLPGQISALIEVKTASMLFLHNFLHF